MIRRDFFITLTTTNNYPQNRSAKHKQVIC